MTVRPLHRIDGTPIHGSEYGIPDEQTLEEVVNATVQTLANEIPGFQVGPRIGGSMLGTLAILRTIEATTNDLLGQGNSSSAALFRFSSQQPRPVYRELRRMGPRIALEYRAHYQTPPHVDRFERGLAVHHQFGTVERHVSLAHLLDDTAPLEAQVNHNSFLASEGANYQGIGISDPAIENYIGDIYEGETSAGVLTVFADGHLCIDALNGSLRRSVHYFENKDSRAGVTDWTRYSGRKSDAELSTADLELRSARFSATFMHLHATQLFKDIQAQGISAADLMGVTSSDTAADTYANVDVVSHSPSLARSLLRYANHPGHGNRIHYNEDSQMAFLSEPGDLDGLRGQP